jgi:uncharacterized protein YndB with AHSA1/START domain
MNTTKERLTVMLPSDNEIHMERTFDAPRALVFEAVTRPEHVTKWWGCGGGVEKLAVCEIDLRVGGSYRFLIRKPGGQEYAFKGVYREIVQPSRLVYTQIYDVEPFNTHEAIVTTIFDEHDGRTTLRETTWCASKAVRDGWLQSGMEQGAGKSLDALAELLQTLKKPSHHDE